MIEMTETLPRNLTFLERPGSKAGPDGVALH
jgi:hypothetical protein